MVLAGQDAWRKHPFLTECGKKPFTGLGMASALFSIYLAVDFITSRNQLGQEHSAHPELDYIPRGKFKYARGEVGEPPALS